jgi:CRISPR-associated protein (TIGR03986 family)
VAGLVASSDVSCAHCVALVVNVGKSGDGTWGTEVTQFVNPYTFVPHAATVQRGMPSGHAAMADGNVSGFLDVTLTARTPVLIGGFGTDGKPELPHRVADGKVIVPGSGLMGAVRSLHEALAGGCLRVLNSDWVPVHRHPASTSYTKDLRLAVVSRVKEGQPTEVRLCDRWIWVPARLLPTGNGQLPRTGDHLQYQPERGRNSEIPDRALTGVAGRRVLRARSEQHPDGIPAGSLVTAGQMGRVAEDCWVLLVTDTNARSGKRPVYFALGKTGPGSRACDVPDETWTHYQAMVAGADDQRRESLKKAGVTGRKEPPWDPEKPSYAEVPPPPGSEDDTEALGERLRARTYFYEGQPIWVKVRPDDNTVSEIRLSQFWRYAGDHPVGERVGEAGPCTEPDELCWSCRLFGSADTEGRGADDLAVQHSYRGHIRIDDLVAEGEVQPLAWDLAPLASPKPSAGQFYLDNKGRQMLAQKDTPAAATWGSVADDGREPRPIRGRKYYWRTTDPTGGQVPRGKKRAHQSEAMSGKAHLIPAGTRFHGRIAFDNLSLADLGSLLAALDPRQLGHVDGEGWAGTVTSVGGGKPFGFGAVTIEVSQLQAQTAAERYLGEPGRGIDAAEAVQGFHAAVPREAMITWSALRNALTFGFVPDELVWYPPGTGTRGEESYDKSFEFFATSIGLRLAEETRELVVLPDAARPARDQELPSDGRVRKHPRQDDGRPNGNKNGGRGRNG